MSVRANYYVCKQTFICSTVVNIVQVFVTLVYQTRRYCLNTAAFIRNCCIVTTLLPWNVFFWHHRVSVRNWMTAKTKKKICARMGATSEEIRIKKDKILIDFHATSCENLQDIFFSMFSLLPLLCVNWEANLCKENAITIYVPSCQIFKRVIACLLLAPRRVISMYCYYELHL